MANHDESESTQVYRRKEESDLKKTCYCARPLSLIKCKFYRILKKNDEILCLMCVCVCMCMVWEGVLKYFDSTPLFD